MLPQWPNSGFPEGLSILPGSTQLKKQAVTTGMSHCGDAARPPLNPKKKNPIARVQYSSARMIVSTRVVASGLAGSSEPAVSVRS